MLYHWDRVAEAKQDFIFRVIEPAEAGKILISFPVDAPNRFQDADGWSQACRNGLLAAEESMSAHRGYQIVKPCGDRQNEKCFANVRKKRFIPAHQAQHRDEGQVMKECHSQNFTGSKPYRWRVHSP